MMQRYKARLWPSLRFFAGWCVFLCVLTVTRIVTKIILMKLGYRDRRRLEAVLGKPLEKYPVHSKYFADCFRARL